MGAKLLLFSTAISRVIVSVFLFVCFLPSSVDARLYFFHIRKTGGTTLRFLLEQQLAVDEIYPHQNCKHATSLVNHELVSGHFPYWFCKNLDEQFEDSFKVTILRDPVDRYLSFLRFRKTIDRTFPDLESVLKLREMPNGDIHPGTIDNAICRDLASDPHLEGQELLESAMRTLRELDFVIFFDHFTKDVIELFECFDIVLEEKDVPKMNITQKEPISEHILEEAIRLNKLDIQLYAYAKAHFKRKNVKYTLRTQSYENILKQTRDLDYTFDLPLNGKGWTYREVKDWDGSICPCFRWVTDKPAYIYFLFEKGLDYELSFQARCLTSDIAPRIMVNGHEVELKRLDNMLFSTYQGMIPKEIITDDPTELAFYSLNAFHYRDIYPRQFDKNHPPVSFAVNRIKIIPNVIQKLEIPNFELRSVYSF